VFKDFASGSRKTKEASVDGINSIREFMVIGLGNTANETMLPLVKQLRDALQNAETELQRRCFISAEIRAALAAANAFLRDR